MCVCVCLTLSVCQCQCLSASASVCVSVSVSKSVPVPVLVPASASLSVCLSLCVCVCGVGSGGISDYKAALSAARPAPSAFAAASCMHDDAAPSLGSGAGVFFTGRVGFASVGMARENAKSPCTPVGCSLA